MGSNTKLLNSRYKENSDQIDEKVVIQFPSCVYCNIDDLAKTAMNPTNCRSTSVSLRAKNKYFFTTSKLAYVYSDVIKSNLVVDFYFKV
jgi:hypothetical protein